MTSRAPPALIDLGVIDPRTVPPTPEEMTTDPDIARTDCLFYAALCGSPRRE